ncbi:ferric reduction oxidase 2-like [Rhododendron vialii]|uniref:ferric reduction oxidase 2-like n=1 Tax=Rhododendron vialii TaxID=182163 RepID=UPI00265E9112|nr:ferric reduction oxidase 2-like [Rhododendron vialii]
MSPMVAERSSSAPSSRGGIMDPMRAMRAVMMAVVIVVVSGWVFMWVMAPTRVYGQIWLPKIRADTISTFFGTQGATILLYTFPMLFIAVLGSLYLHLGKNNISAIAESKGNKHKLAGIWRRPLIVKGLGIVSRIELAFFAMFIALLVWSFSTYLRISFAKITPLSAAANGEQVWESKLDSAALRLGLVGNICLAFLFFPVTRCSSVLPLFGLTSEASVKYHIWIGHIAMTLFTAHGVCYVIYWVVTHQISQMVKWDKTGVANVAGEIALLAGLAMWVTTFPRIRRKMFELFFYTHHLYIVFIIFFVFHVGIAYSCMMLPGFYLFLVDRFLRFLQSRRGVRLVSARVLPCEAVELSFSKSRGLSYTPTSIMFMNVPGISKMQWHPFTISSSSNLEPEKLSVIIKSEGSWSKKLYQMLSSPNSSLDHLDVSIEGPYGPVSTDFLRHETIVMVSGGSGISPFISIIRDLTFLTETLKCKTPQILLIAVFKNSSDLTLLDLLLPISGAPNGFSNLNLQIQAYVTREKEPITDNRKTHPTTVWFKPKSSNAPISPILGPNSWLWLGAIISLSFVMFLLFLGILTRYYIYPIDHNTNRIYSYSRKAALSMLFICICIATTASAAFYWNKKKGSMEINQIKNMEGASPSASPGSWIYNADRELESLPQQSVVQSTNLHYGERPDLKRILLERKESSIGVLVCGPKKMRHEVASICASGLAENLHFESISFSW